MFRVDGIDPASPGLIAKCAIDEAIATCLLYKHVKRELYRPGMGSITFESNILQLQLLCIGPITITITITFENHHPYYNYNYF